MRLLHRNDEDVNDVRDPDDHDPDVTTRDRLAADEHAHRRSFFRRTPRDDRAAAVTRDEAVRERERAEIERERARDERRAESHEEVVERRKRWDTVGFLTAGYGAALAVMGALALVRTGVDESWYEPVTEVAGVRQSPLLGAIELAAGVVLVLALLVGLRMFAALGAIAAGVAATVVAIEPSRVNPELAIQRGWAIALAAASLACGLLLIATRDRRRERRVVRRPVTA
ncbi:MAG TPA: hypothetical protein VFR26_01885 [Acidimicrobiales bacterium]|nr:hypothetical protein [Acidimicrobiales bacterium]